MTAILAFILGPIGRWLVTGFGILAIAGGIYAKGRIDERAGYKAKIEREISDAINKGDSARADALRKFDAAPDELPDDGFRRP